jgi:hypothetical protein
MHNFKTLVQPRLGERNPKEKKIKTEEEEEKPLIEATTFHLKHP